MTVETSLTCEGVGASYERHRIFRALSATFRPGVHALRGANGIGKSTFLRVLAGAQPPDDGRISICGIDLLRAPEDAKRCLSYVPDESPIYPFMTGAELLHFVAAAKRATPDAIVDGLIAAFGLAAHLHKRFDAMSLGTQKKMMLSAAWVGAPRVVLLDEPSNGLDQASRDYLSALLQHWGRENVVLFSAHDEDFVAACEAHVVEMCALISPEEAYASADGPPHRDHRKY